jgi:methionyl-tRNA formyltransferase
VISFLSPWIVPAAVLARARLAINFHPGSCDYPGIGCYNFALYDGAVRYGAVCHYMAETVDTGTIIREDLFPVAADESVKSLRDRTLDVMLAMFDDIVGLLERGAALPSAPRGWTRRPFLRRELRDLGRITLDMSAEEIRRRVRAMHYPGMPGAEVEIAGVRFVAAPVTP